MTARDAQLTPCQRDVRAAWDKGRHFGMWEGKNAGGYRLPMGMAIGVAIGAVIQPVVFWIKGVCW